MKDNIPILLKYFPNITFRSTIYSKSAEKTFENYLFAIKSGFKNIFMMPDGRHEWSPEEKEKLHQEIHKIYSFLDFCFTSGKGLPISCDPINKSFQRFYNQDLILLQKINNNKNKHKKVTRCGLGANNHVSIGYNGDIISCQEQTSKTGDDNIFYLGNIYKDGIEKTRHINLLEKYYNSIVNRCDNKERCQKCYFSSTCNEEFCPSSSYDLFNEFCVGPEIQCLWLEWLSLDAIILNNKLVNENNLLFKNFLKQKCRFSIYNEKENKK